MSRRVRRILRTALPVAAGFGAGYLAAPGGLSNIKQRLYSNRLVQRVKSARQESRARARLEERARADDYSLYREVRTEGQTIGRPVTTTTATTNRERKGIIQTILEILGLR